MPPLWHPTSGMFPSQQRVVVLGASHKPARYSNQAIRLLLECGHTVVPVHPRLGQVEGLPVVASLDALVEPVDTLTLYVGPERSRELVDAIVRLRPGRVIFNPGTENPALETRLDAAGIRHERACTLVLLRTAQF
ncbi:MAG: CoA-binding protein [Thiobacillus sp.]